MAGKHHSRKQTEKEKGLSRIVLIILTAAAACLLLIMGVRLYKEIKKSGKDPENKALSSSSKAENTTPGSNTAAKTDSPGAGTGKTEGETADTPQTADALQALISSMTLEEKIAQMFIITPEALTGFEQAVDAGEAVRSALSDYPVGGLIFFKTNIQNPQQITEMIADTKEYAKAAAKLPVLIAVDEEGGSVARIAGNPQFPVEKFPDMSAIGASGDISKAYEVGNVIGSYLKEYGFNMDFAPDADVLTNPDNTVVAMRSFGSDPHLVSAMAGQTAKGLMDQGIIPVYKHFPGHGSTKGDTHEGFSYTDRTLEELRESELVPFADAVENGIPCIMAAHIAAVAVDGDKPASLSKVLITDVLRGELGFDGVVITDAMNMGAVQNLYSSGEAAVMAVEAGADLLLMPENFQEAYETLLNAVKEGQISEDRIDLSMMRIAVMKAGLQ